MSKLETNTIDTVSGTTNLTIGSTNSSTVTFENGAVTGHMYPALKVYLTATQSSVADNTFTTVNMTGVDTDTSNGWSTSDYKYTVPSNMGGKYFIYAQIRFTPSATNAIDRVFMRIYAGASGSENERVQYSEDANGGSFQHFTATSSVITDLNAGDKVYLQGFCDVTSGTVSFTGTATSKESQLGLYRIGS